MEEYLRLIESSHLQVALNNIPRAKRDCLDAVKLLNSSLEDAAILRPLSKYTLTHYEALTKPFTFIEKLKWLSSKLGDQIYPPLIDFEGVTSLHRLFIGDGQYEDPDTTIEQFPDMDVSYDHIQTDWSSNITDLTTLYQDVLANCSFVSSLLSISDTLQDATLSNLIVAGSDNSKLRVCLNFNGCERLVTIDNRLPFLSKNLNRNLFVKSLNNEKLLWPALIEKAYLKIMANGYRFIGSNMSIDTYILTGWIPETITLNDFSLPANFDELWRLKQSGKVFLGIGTGILSSGLSSKVGLVTEHDYSINGYANGVITIKNPWIEKGDDKKRYISTSNINHFKYLYVNWRVDHMFKNIHKVNGIYTLVARLHEKPQYSLHNHTEKPQEVWILLEKHLPSKTGDLTISVVVYETEKGERVYSHKQYKCANSDMSTNNRFKLIKFTLQPLSFHTIIIISAQPCTFTLSLYNNVEMTLNKARNKYPYILPLQDSWEAIKSNGGGSWALSTYINNPQYSLDIREETDLVLVLLSTNRPLLNINMFHCDKHEKDVAIRNFDKSKLIFNERYNEGFQIINQHLVSGHYKLIVSTYENNLYDQFELILNYSTREAVSITKISNSLGLFMDKKQFQWNNTNRYKLNFVAENHNSKFTFKISHFNHTTQDYDSSSDYRPAIRASIFCATTTKPIQINELWNDSLYGVFVDCLLDEPGKFILLIERFEMGQGRCNIDIGCNKKFYIV